MTNVTVAKSLYVMYLAFGPIIIKSKYLIEQMKEFTYSLTSCFILVTRIFGDLQVTENTIGKHTKL